MKTADGIRLSPSSLSVLRSCPRCFWYEQVPEPKIKRPRGIYPSLPGGMDRAMKRYVEFSICEPEVPFHLQGMEGAVFYPDRTKVKTWQNNFKGLSCMLGDVEVRGAIDDLILWPDGRVSPLDFKTRGAAPKEGQSEGYYGPQMDIYHLLLQKDAGLKCTGTAYLRYAWPREVINQMVEFSWLTYPMDSNPGRALMLIEEAVSVIRLAVPPESAIDCEYCAYVAERGKTE